MSSASATINILRHACLSSYDTGAVDDAFLATFFTGLLFAVKKMPKMRYHVISRGA